MRFGNYWGSRPKAALFAVGTLTIGCAIGVAAVAAAHHTGPWPAATIKEATHSGTTAAPALTYRRGRGSFTWTTVSPRPRTHPRWPR